MFRDTGHGTRCFERACRYVAAGNFEAGIASLLEAADSPFDPTAVCHALGTAYRVSGDVAEAVRWLTRATGHDSGDVLSWRDLALVSAQTSNWADTCLACFHWTRLERNDAEGWQLWARALREQGRYRAALSVLVRGWRANRGGSALASAAGTLYVETGNIRHGLGFLRRAVALDPSSREAWSNWLFTLTCDDAASPEEQIAEHRRFGEQHSQRWDVGVSRRAPSLRSGKIRIGYVSAELRRHPMERFYEPVFAHHDRSRFELFAYASVGNGDGSTGRIRTCFDHWRDITALSDLEAARKIVDDDIDILVDLSGHTLRGRLGIFAGRAAPVQITHIGYPNTTGLSEMDWLVTDSLLDPPGVSEAFYSEQLLRIDPCFVCFAAPHRDVIPEFDGNVDDMVTFGSCNPVRKLSPPAIDLWSRVLLAVPDSRLVFRNWAVSDPAVAQRLAREFAKRGVAKERVKALPFTRDEATYLETYRQFDICLDPLPYSGHTTTCEALWMGVPVLTLPGRTHVSRVSMTLLRAAGFPEWVARTPDEYVALAAELATRPRALRSSRALMRRRLERSVLMDQSGFTRKLEAALISTTRNGRATASSPATTRHC